MLTEAALLVSLSVKNGPETDDCATRAQLSHAVERRLRRRVFVSAEQAQLRVDIAFSKRGAETEATIRLSDLDGRSRGTRSLSTEKHCSALDDSLALSVALLVDEPPEPEPEPEPAPSAVPAADAAPAPAPPPPPPPARPTTAISIPADVVAPREPWHLAVGVAATAAWGLLPELRPGLALQAQLTPRGFVPILLQGEGFLSSSAERDASSGATFRLLRAGLALCPRLVEGQRSNLGLCIGEKLGWMKVEGYGFDQNVADGRLTFALSLGAEGRLQLWKALWLRGYLGGEIPIVRDRFTSGGHHPVELFQPSPVALSGEIGIEAALW
jgi:hypothetical protein